MNSRSAYVLFNTVILLLLNQLIQPKALSISSCSLETTSPIEGKALSEIFGGLTFTKLKDVEALKYFCINAVISSTISSEVVSQLKA